MGSFRISVFLAMLVLVAGPLAAAEPLPTTTPGDHAAQVSGTPGWPNRDIYPVRIIAVNGRNIPAREYIWLEPGTYTVTVAIDATRSPFPPMYRPRQRDRQAVHEIELELEAGKTYQIRARIDRYSRTKPYTAMLWKVDDS